MDQTIAFLLGKVFGGGPEGLLALAMVVIAFLLWERHRLLALLEKKDEKIDKIIDDYHAGNITLADALNSLRIVLYEVKAKL